MYKYVFVNSEGLINHSVQTAMNTWSNGEVTEDGLTVYDFSEDSRTLTEICTNKYVSEGEFIDMPERPYGDEAYYYFTSASGWEFNYEGFIQAIRKERNIRLGLTDWTQLPDAASRLTEDQVSAYTAYRQSLADLPTTFTGEERNMLDISWPVLPWDEGVEI